SHVAVAAVIARIWLYLKWEPHLGSLHKLLRIKVGREDPNHDIVVTAEGDCGTKNLRIAAEATNPESVAEHRNVSAMRPIFIKREGAASKDRCSKEVEEIRCNTGYGDELRGRPAC